MFSSQYIVREEKRVPPLPKKTYIGTYLLFMFYNYIWCILNYMALLTLRLTLLLPALEVTNLFLRKSCNRIATYRGVSFQLIIQARYICCHSLDTCTCQGHNEVCFCTLLIPFLYPNF